MAEFIAVLNDIKRLPQEVHLLCPRQHDDDQDQYEEDNNDDQERLRRIAEAKSRRKRFMMSLQLLAYDGRESEEYHEYIFKLLDLNLGRCDVCIKEYYIARMGFLAELQEEYDEEDIKKFFAIIDRRDITRIKRGLAGATKSLRDLPEQKRGISVLDPPHLHAIFEALICESFFADESLLSTYFDDPFSLIQVRKPLRIREFLPAVTTFLLSPNKKYHQWAVSTWDRIDRSPTDLEWAWGMKNTLQQHLQEATSPERILILWSALKIIEQKLEPRQIAQSLCDLVPNVCATALNHLSKRTHALPLILQSLDILLSKAPGAFWQAMGPISSSTVAEQVFASPYFEKMLQEQTANGEADASSLALLSWISPFLQSIRPANRQPPCRTLATQLSQRVRSPQLSSEAKEVCHEAMLKVLKQTIVSFSDDEAVRLSVSRVVLSDTLDTISENIDLVLEPHTLKAYKPRRQKLRSDGLDIVRNALALECQCLKADFETLSGHPEGQAKQSESSSYSPDIWNAVVRNLNRGDIDLASAAVLGIMALPGLEQFRAKNPKDMSKAKEAYNMIFEKLTGMVSEILERLSDFKPEDLDELYKAQKTSMSLISLLFSADNRTYQAAVDLVKKISGEAGRKEALAHLLNAYLGTTVYGICWTFRRIHQMRTFAAVPRMLKSGMEILDVLCNTQTGILRTQSIEDRDSSAIQSYWSYQWAALNTIFQQTEKWSYEVHDKALMTDVCRDAMQYAEALFEQYDVFAGALITAKPGKAKDIPGTLLDAKDAKWGSPGKTLHAMARWLRLRDEYLADTLVKLLTKMLYRLGDHDSHIDTEGLRYVQDVATKSTVKTNLSDSQKAQLIQALESFTKETIAPSLPTRQSKLQNWINLRASDPTGSSTPVSRAQSVDEFGDSDIADSDFYELSGKLSEAHKANTAARVREGTRILSSTSSLQKAKSLQSQLSRSAKREQESRAFIENRRRETEARKLRDKEAAAKLRGAIGVGEQTKGQGSGLKGIGVKGKDHVSGRESMMVSSDSEPDSDSSHDELDKQLFGDRTRTNRLLSSKAGRLPTGPVKKTKQQHSQKDIRARLAPDLSSMHRTILGWDFFSDTEMPPNSEPNHYTLVSNTFKTAVDYQRTFEPLLILEGWQSFRSAREDGNFKSFELKISNQIIVDSFVELNTSMPLADGKDMGIGIADIILLSKAERPADAPDQPHCLARVKQINRKKNNVEIVYRVNAAKNPLRSMLNQGGKVWGAQILSLTPLEREYGALMALPFYDLCDEIIRAKPSPLLDYPPKELQNIVKTYDVNTAQAKAVRSALDNDAFTLIQGPPGSGKTKTICALVGAMVTDVFKSQRRLKESPSGPANARPNPPVPATKKILVCAPSNAAVDELVMRFKEGIKTLEGSTEQLSVVRLGRSDAINASVKDVTLEELVNARLKATSPKDAKDENIYEVMMEHKATSEQLNTLINQFGEMHGRGQHVKSEDETRLEGLKRKRTQLSERIDKIRERQNTASRDAELNKKRMRQAILDSAHVLCATLSGSGHEVFQGLNIEFETVIIDEAAQSIELSALIPLKYGCSKCILVGDPKQLPPTVLSKEAAKFQYEQSLFARMEKNHQKDVHLLDTQYRMHPEISLFPSKTFYDGKLKDGPDMAKLRARPWHHSRILGPYRFFDVQGMSSAASKSHSLINIAEINVAMQLYDRLITDVRQVDLASKVGIITPYKGQLRELKSRFLGHYGQEILSKIEFNTTDAFQGRECDIIIFSCVRASTRGIGFLNDIRRMNVGLTRAKCSLWVLGNSASLSQGEFWKALIKDARSRDLYTDGDILSLLARPLLTVDMMKDDIEMVDSNDGSTQAATSSSISNPAAVVKPSIQEGNPRIVSSLPTRSETYPSSAGLCSGRSGTSPPTSLPKQERANSERQSSAPKLQQHTNGVGDFKKRTSSSAALPKPEGAPRPPIDQKKGPNGPSGGHFGLNDNAVCGICGSEAHFSYNCDNAAARAASLGLCQRCKGLGHSIHNCGEPRCIECGMIGHLTSACNAAPVARLSAAEKELVKKQEIDHGMRSDKYRQKRAEKQLAEHGAKIPLVRSSILPSNGMAGDGKRKHEHGGVSDAAKAPKAMKLSGAPSAEMNGPKGRGQGGPRIERTQGTDGEGMVGPRATSQDDPSRRALESGGTGRRASGHPPMKRKKPREEDVFLKKR